MQKNLAVRPAVGTALVLLIPLVMTIVDRQKPLGAGWNWSPPDFLIMGILIFGAGLSYEFFARKLNLTAHRLALGLFILGVVLVIWAQLAVQAVSQAVTFLFG